MALVGYAFKATGAALGTVATIYDPVLRAAITTLTIRGDKRTVNVQSCVYNSDAPGLGSHATLSVGNDGVDRYVYDMFPNLDGDLATQPVMLNGMSDLGGFEVNENETMTITVYDPGAAELTSGVLYVEDGEPTYDIVSGRPVTLSFGGTNDAGSSISITGGDKPVVKLEENYNYGVIGGKVRSEDKICEVNILLDGNGHSCTLPGMGKIVLPAFAFVFTGAQWNQGSVNQYLQVQAATKVETIYDVIEFASSKATGTEKPIQTNPLSFPGQPAMPAARSAGNVGGGAIGGGGGGFSLGSAFGFSR